MEKTRTLSFERSLVTGYNISLLLPDTVLCDKSVECVAIFNAPIPNHVEYFVKFVSSTKSTFVRGDRLNDTTLTFTTPGNFPAGSAKITIHHGVNHNLLCNYSNVFNFQSKLDHMHNLLQTVSDPMSFLANIYGLDKFDQDSTLAVDFKLEKAFNSNKPSQFNILQSDEIDKDTNTDYQTRNPTLLHFAARYNLIRLCVSLLDCPGGKDALNLKNFAGECPHKLAVQCKNLELAKVLSNAKSNDGNGNTTIPESADEIYEHMSPELFERYKEVKKNFMIYESMNEHKDEVYEDMFSSRCNSASSHKGADQQSISSVDSNTSTDSKGSNGRQQLDSAPPLPPQDYRLPKRANPLLEELKRKNEGKKNPILPPSTPPPRPPMASKVRPPKPPSPRVGSMEDKKAILPLNLLHTRSQFGSTGGLPDDLYDAPPPRPSPLFTASNNSTFNDIYDVPPTNNTSISEEDVYDTPPSRITAVPTSPANSDTTDGFDIYDTPPLKTLSSENSLYVPASTMSLLSKREDKEASQEDTYDFPPSRLSDPPKVPVTEPEGFETYDVPKKSIEVEDETYDVPVKHNGLHDEIQDKFGNLRTTLSNSTQDLTQTARIKGFPSRPETARLGKRMSEPVLPAFSRADQQRLLAGQQAAVQRSHMPLPIPPRNSTNLARSPKTGRRSIVPPPLPPQRRPTNR